MSSSISGVCGDLLSAGEIRSRLHGSFWGEIAVLNKTGSTNDAAMSMPMEADGKSGTVVLADMQEQGRGRYERRWVSPPGMNIYLSILFRPAVRVLDAPFLTMVAALAAASAIRTEAGAAVAIKWPNDLMISDKKTGGILTEAKVVNGVISRAVIGIGINVNLPKEELPQELAARATSLLIETSRHYSRNRLIASLLNEFEARYKILLDTGRLPLVNELRGLLSSLGKEVSVSDGREKIRGFVQDIGEDGRLLLRLPNGGFRHIGSGELLETG